MVRRRSDDADVVGMQLWSRSCVVGCDICAKMTP